MSLHERIDNKDAHVEVDWFNLGHDEVFLEVGDKTGFGDSQIITAVAVLTPDEAEAIAVALLKAVDGIRVFGGEQN